MHMMIVKAIADGSGPDITGRTVPMPAGSYHMCREDDRSWFEQRADVFELQPRDETESPVTATRDASGNVVGLSAGNQNVGSIGLLFYANESGFAALPESVEQIMGDVVLIPAGTLQPGDKLQFVTNTTDAGTASAHARTVRVRIHTTPSVLSGQSLVGGTISTATNTKFTVDKTVVIVSNTIARTNSNSVAGGVISATSTLSIDINCAVDQYIGITIENANTLVNHLVYFASLVLEKTR